MKNLFSRTRIFLSHSFCTFQKYQPKKKKREIDDLISAGVALFIFVIKYLENAL